MLSLTPIPPLPRPPSLSRRRSRDRHQGKPAPIVTNTTLNVCRLFGESNLSLVGDFKLNYSVLRLTSIYSLPPPIRNSRGSGSTLDKAKVRISQGVF